jgi:outer membrane protein assembly factor BamB
MTRSPLLALAAVLLLSAPAAGDWPHWLGPNHNGSSPEKGLLTQLPKGGPKVLWKVAGGEGYSAVVVAGGKAVTQVQRGGEELVLALDANTGKELWKTKIAGGFKNAFGNGPRATPAIEGSFVYANAVTGPVVCLKAASGELVWEKNILKEFGAKNITWGLSASPLIEGDLVLVIPGAKGAGVAALDKKSGKTVWKTSDDPASYASPVAVTAGGKRQIAFFTAPGLLGVEAKTGKELWRVPWKTEYDVNICTPLVLGDRMFVATGEDVGCALFKFNAQGKPAVEWESKGKKSVMMSYWANAVEHNGYLYGISGQFDRQLDFNCVDLKTGKLMWSKAKYGKASVTLADGHLWVVTKEGDLVLVHANPKGYLERGRVRLLGDNRTVGTIASRRLYLRDLEHIYCLDIAE